MSARGYHGPPQEGRSLPPQQRQATPLPALPSFFGAPHRALGRPRLPAAGPRSSRRRPLSPLPPPSPSRQKQRRERQGAPSTSTFATHKKEETPEVLKNTGFILQNIGQWHININISPASPSTPTQAAESLGWALPPKEYSSIITPKLRPFKAQKCLNPVSTVPELGRYNFMQLPYPYPCQTPRRSIRKNWHR